MSLYLLAFISSLLYVGSKSVQQCNVASKVYSLILPFSFIMAFLEIFIIGTISGHDGNVWWLACSLGFGGGLGSMAATYLHDRMLTEEK